MNNEELAAYLKEHPTDTARQELLYMNNLVFLQKYIRRYFPCNETEDLLQESYFAMLEAVKGYDETKGKFLTYLGWHLWSHLTRYVYNYSGIGISTNELINKYDKTIMELEKQGIKPTVRIVAYKMGVSVKKVQELEKLRASRVDISTNKEIGEDITLLDAIADYNTDVESTVLDRIEKEELKRDIWECVERLPKEQADIIVRHYRQQEQYKDIAEDLEISYQQVTQRKTEAFRKMRRDSQTLKQLKPYIEDMRSTALQGNGVGTFKRTWTSSTERAVLLQEKYNNVMAEINQLKQRTKSVP